MVVETMATTSAKSKGVPWLVSTGLLLKPHPTENVTTPMHHHMHHPSPHFTLRSNLHPPLTTPLLTSHPSPPSSPKPSPPTLQQCTSTDHWSRGTPDVDMMAGTSVLVPWRWGLEGGGRGRCVPCTPQAGHQHPHL